MFLLKKKKKKSTMMSSNDTTLNDTASPFLAIPASNGSPRSENSGRSVGSSRNGSLRSAGRRRSSQVPPCETNRFIRANRKISFELFKTLLNTASKVPRTIDEEDTAAIVDDDEIIAFETAFIHATRLNLDDLQTCAVYLRTAARYNLYVEIQRFNDECADDPDFFIQALLVLDESGNTAPMIAAAHNSKESLLLFLAPFLTSQFSLDKLLHQTNKYGQKLLGLVVHHRRNLLVAHGILVELEAKVHGDDSWSVKTCLRDTLGSTSGAADTLNLYSRIEKKDPTSLLFSHAWTCIKIFLLSFLFRVLFLLFDLYTDVRLLQDYSKTWSNDSDIVKSNTTDNNNRIYNICGGNRTEEYNQPPFQVSSSSSFYITLALISLPTVFNVFELLRFRLASKQIDKHVGKSNEAKADANSNDDTNDDHPEARPRRCQQVAVFFLKSVVNVFLLLSWLPVVLWRNFWFRSEFETSATSQKVSRYRKSYRIAQTIALRAQLIKACTEASLQPLVQLYLLFNKIRSEPLEEIFDLLPTTSPRNWPLISVLVSILALAISFTVNYRENKENSMGFGATLVYFVYIIMAVVARITCFEIFAFSLGENWYCLIIAIATHVLLMTALHFLFSDAYTQCIRLISGEPKLQDWVRQISLVIHNCFVNGLANLYIHNNLEIFVTVTEAEAETEKKSEKGRKKKTSVTGFPTASFSPIDVQQRTFVRQVIVDVVILIENVAMIVAAGRTDHQCLYHICVGIVVATYTSALVLKIVFYLCFHPWSDLIRLQPYCIKPVEPDHKVVIVDVTNIGTDEVDAETRKTDSNPDVQSDNQVATESAPIFSTSCIFLGCHVDAKVDRHFRFQFKKNPDQDRFRNEMTSIAFR